MTRTDSLSAATMRKTKGFTFIEMMLALVIFAMLAMATQTVFRNVIDSKDTIEHTSAQLSDLQRAMILIEGDFHQIAQRKVRINGEAPADDYLRAEPFLLDSDENGIAFVRDGWTNPVLILPRSEMQAVGYRTKENVLERLYTNYVDADTSTEPRVQQLLEGVSKIELRYFIDDEWQEELPDDKWPALIKLILHTETFGEIERVFPLFAKTEGASEGSK